MIKQLEQKIQKIDDAYSNVCDGDDEWTSSNLIFMNGVAVLDRHFGVLAGNEMVDVGDDERGL